MRHAAVLLLALILAVAASFDSARAEPRVALVIGNSNYGGDLGLLPNPENDAKLMAKTLRGIGFDVVEVENADQQAMKQAIADFGEKLSNAGDGSTGLFFYAGHGVQVGGTNYLIPIHVSIKREAEVDLQAVAVDTVLKQMNWAGSAVNIVILDACRNNPLTRSMRDMNQGLAEITMKPRGSFISYSTAPGDVAEDGNGVDSPFTTALAQTIVEPGKSLNDVFQEVRGKVLKATDQKQTPWDSSSLTAPYYFVPAVAAPPPTPPVSGTATTTHTNGADSAEIEFWQSAKAMNSAAAYQAYLDQYPAGAFAKLAQLKIDSLKAPAVTASNQALAVAAAETPANGTATPSAVAPPPAAAAPAAVPPAAVASKSAPGPIVAAPPPASSRTLLAFTDLSQSIYPQDKARVREAPALDAAVLTRASSGMVLEATGRSEDLTWWRITLPDGRTGYIQASVASDQPPAAAAASAGSGTAATATASAGAGKKDADVCPTGSGAAAADRADACKRVLAGNNLDKDAKVTALVDYGNALDDLGRSDEALQQYHAAIDLDPKSAAAYYNMGLVHQGQGRYPEARAAFDKAATLNPDDPDAIYQRGVTVADIGDFSAALTDIQRAIAMKSDEGSYYDELAFLRLAGGDTDAAQQAMDQAISVQADYWSSTGVFAYYLGGRLKDALAQIDAALKGNPDYPYWGLWKGLILKAQYDEAGAASALAAGIQRLQKGAWPRPLLEYVAGHITEARLRTLAQSPDPTVLAQRLCEVNYYVGEVAYLRRDTSAARRAMQQVIDGRIYNYLEYAAAKARLAMLNR